MRLPAVLLLVPSACAAGSPATDGAALARVERQVVAMGTWLRLEVVAPDRATALAASEAAVRAMEAAELRLSTWRDDTELARLNAAPAGRAVALSPALREDLATATSWAVETNGAFDPVVGALVEAWALRRGGRRPSPAEQQEALANSGLQWLRLDAEGAARLRTGAQLEEGAFGKGAGVRDALRALDSAGALGAVLDLGGQVSVLGGFSYLYALADPRDRARPLLRIEIDHGSLATSGNGELGFLADGRRFGHLLDPRRGEPAPDFGSLTVWAPEPFAADCLSTGLYVLGREAALDWAAGHEGFEVLVLESTGDRVRATATEGLHRRLEPLQPDVDLETWPSPGRMQPQ